ncbi:MFS transporter [Gilliamella sp. B3562]|uniref:MFS transporter n=2 Tax=unclassified Gilliamella TaxID=2685620 RepID=UPI00226A2141|nr:MFS transporter [Gilliamella sp. B3562]
MKSMLKEETIQKKSSLILSAILIVLLVGSVYISQLIFQEISKSYHIDILEARNVFSLSCFFYAISFFIYGPLSDNVSTKLLVLIGSIGTICCLILSVIIDCFNLYLVVMSLIGFFAAAVPAALFAYTAKNTPNHKLPQAMGIMISASIVGIIFSRSVIAMLTDFWSWQIAFIIYAGFIILACLFVPFGIKQTTNQSPTTSLIGTYFSALKLFLDKTVVIFLVIGFLLFFVYLGISSLLTFYLKGAPFYLSSTVLGWLNFAGLSAVVGSMITGKLTQVINEKYLFIICLLAVCVSIATIGFSSSLYVIGLGIFCLFLFVFGIQPLVIAMLNKIVPISSRGAISSLYLLACLAGGSIGTYLLGIVYQNKAWIGAIILCVFLSIVNLILALIAIRLIRNSIKN